MKKKYNVLSLCNGMSCGMIALKELGVDVGKYYSSETNKFCNQLSSHLYPEIIQLGDIKNWFSWDIDFSTIDLVLCGFPCQSFSKAGHGKGVGDERGQIVYYLKDIWETVELTNFNAKFMFECSVTKKFLPFLNDLFGCEPTRLNSKYVSAQLRDRYYWTNFAVNPVLKDYNILLKDIVEPGTFVDRDKSLTITKNYRGGTYKQYKKKSRRQLVGALRVGTANIKGFDCIKRVYSLEGKCPTLTTCEGGNRIPKISIYQNPHGKNKGGIKNHEKSSTLTSHTWEYNNFLTDGLIWRPLTIRECARLQTIPEHLIDLMLSSKLSKTQLIKMLGNGWTINVIKHILKILT